MIETPAVGGRGQLGGIKGQQLDLSSIILLSAISAVIARSFSKFLYRATTQLPSQPCTNSSLFSLSSPVPWPLQHRNLHQVSWLHQRFIRRRSSPPHHSLSPTQCLSPPATPTPTKSPSRAR